MTKARPAEIPVKPAPVVAPLPKATKHLSDDDSDVDHEQQPTHDESEEEEEVKGLSINEQARRTAQRYGTFKHPEDFDPIMIKPCKSDEVCMLLSLIICMLLYYT